MRVVIVDDNQQFRAAARLVLSDPDIQIVDEATCAAEAESVIERAAPDVVLVDVGLTDGDGVELVARLASQWPLIRWILTSALAELGDRVRLSASPARAFVPKWELTPQRLREAAER